MSVRGPALLSAMLVLYVWPSSARAGMPSLAPADIERSVSLVLADPTRLRLDAISFFVVVLLGCAAIVRWTWNSARREFRWLPALSYGKSLALIGLWGLLFVIVLTMISGARELMTPGAWEKQGLTYRLTEPTADPIEQQISARCRTLERLLEKLSYHARLNEGKFPAPHALGEIPDELWRMPGGGQYVYVGGRLFDPESGESPAPVVYESGEVGADRLVGMNHGGVVWLPAHNLERKRPKEQP